MRETKAEERSQELAGSCEGGSASSREPPEPLCASLGPAGTDDEAKWQQWRERKARLKSKRKTLGAQCQQSLQERYVTGIPPRRDGGTRRELDLPHCRLLLWRFNYDSGKCLRLRGAVAFDCTRSAPASFFSLRRKIRRDEVAWQRDAELAWDWDESFAGLAALTSVRLWTPRAASSEEAAATAERGTSSCPLPMMQRPPDGLFARGYPSAAAANGLLSEL